MSYQSAPKPPQPEMNNPDWVNPAHPVDAVAERSLIACLLDKPERMPDALLLMGSAEVFGNEAYRILFDTLQGLYRDDKPVKLSSVLQRLNASGDIKTLTSRGISLMDLGREARLTDLSETCLYLRGLWVKRLAVDTAGSLIQAVAGGESVDQIAAQASALHESITAGMSIGSDKTLTDYLSESLTQLDQVMSRPGQLTGVNTGSGKLNRHLGGWQTTDVIMIAGRPGMGKSVAGVYHATAAAEAGTPVAFLSLEMPARSLVNRMISARTGIPYSDIKKGNVSADQARTIHEASGVIERLPVHFYDDFGRDINDLTYKLIHWQKRYGIGLVVIDYVQLLTDRTVRGNDEYAVLTEVSKKLKVLQRRLNCPLIELAQLNRGVEGRTNKRGGLSDLRNTGQFEQDASVVIMQYRPDYYAELSAREEAEKSGYYQEPARNHLLEYGIVKNRDGYTGTVILHADVSLNRIADNAPTPQPAGWDKTTQQTPF